MADKPARAEATTHDLVIELLTRFDNMEERQEELRHVVFGNGVPGLKGQVAALVTESLGRQWLNRALVVALLTPCVGGTVVGVAYFIKHLP